MKQSERKAATLRKIVAAATEVFASAGYEDAKLDDIASRARIGKGTIYNHFKDKEDLFLGTIENSFSELFMHIEPVSTEGRDHKSTLRCRIDRYLAFAEENPDLFRMILKSLSFSDGRHGRFISELFQNQIMKMASMDRGDFTFRQDRYHPLEVGGCGLGMVHHFVFQWLMSGKSYSLRAKGEVITDILFGGLLYISETTEVSG